MFSTNTFSFKDKYDDDDLNINSANPVDDFFDNIADYKEALVVIKTFDRQELSA